MRITDGHDPKLKISGEPYEKSHFPPEEEVGCIEVPHITYSKSNNRMDSSCHGGLLAAAAIPPSRCQRMFPA